MCSKWATYNVPSGGRGVSAYRPTAQGLREGVNERVYLTTGPGFIYPHGTDGDLARGGATDGESSNGDDEDAEPDFDDEGD